LTCEFTEVFGENFFKIALRGSGGVSDCELYGFDGSEANEQDGLTVVAKATATAATTTKRPQEQRLG
jgi:hypothetical protein